jgi:hypothetical protein
MAPFEKIRFVGSEETCIKLLISRSSDCSYYAGRAIIAGLAGAQRRHAHADGAPCCCAYIRRLGDGTEAAAAEGGDERDRVVFARSIEPVISLWMAWTAEIDPGREENVERMCIPSLSIRCSSNSRLRTRLQHTLMQRTMS